ncbi:MAG: glycosyltransferase family 2 protein [Solirubrobacteraceae bacterium]
MDPSVGDRGPADDDRHAVDEAAPHALAAVDVPRTDPRVQVVVVAYNSARTLAQCIAPFTTLEGVEVTVVDNASPDDSAQVVEHLGLDVVRAADNRGFSAGCNIGIARGLAPYVLLLNPDAQLSGSDLELLVAVLDRESDVAIAAPRIVEEDGAVALSQARFPRRRSTFAQALFLHRVWPNALWTDEFIRDPATYGVAGSPEWVSGACLLVRRAALDAIGPMDERFFLYCEDTDLCARVRAAGWDIRYEPRATVRHEGGVSSSRDELLAVHARSRVLYARKHSGVLAALVEAIGVALGHATHALANVGRPAARRGHLRALAALVSGTSHRPTRSRPA